MVFSYYSNLSRAQKAIYRKSDAIVKVAVSDAANHAGQIALLSQSLQEENRTEVESVAFALMNDLARTLGAPPLIIKVLNNRPSNNAEELHGLYEPLEADQHARITVWMRTARHKKVVAFRSFLRTLLHEFCHHLDYELFMLEESFHTEGFFKRESSLFKQLMNEV